MESKTLRVLEFNKIQSKLADKAVCSKTKELAYSLMPHTDILKVSCAQRETTEGAALLLRFGAPPIRPVGDMRPLLKMAEARAALSMRELLEVAYVLRMSRELKQYSREKDFEERYPTISGICSRITPVKELEERIFRTILSEEEMADDASPALLSIRKRKNALSNRVRDTLNEFIHSQKYLKYLQEPIITMRSDRYVLPVKVESRTYIPGIVHDFSSSGQTVYIEPMAVVNINNELRKLDGEEKEEIERILFELSDEVAKNAEFIEQNFDAIINLDFIFAKAKLSLDMNANEPTLNERGIIDIKKARHPLIDPETVVPIDIYLGKDFDTLVITGPNTGGKTVTLKTLGLLTLMAQAGLHISADSGSEIAVFKNVFADIGDEQSIEQSLSTFSAHMVNIINILKAADSNSLVLFDELGAGTDPIEGAALAVAILEYVKQSGAKTAATTHYSEIKHYALSADRVCNAACEFDIETLRPTYRLLIGIPGRSNAFAIASRLGLDESIIRRARELIDSENIRFEDLISDLEKNRAIAREQRFEAMRLKKESEDLKKQAETEQRRLEAQKNKLLSEARKEAKRIVDEAKEETERLIKEIKKAAAEAEAKEREKKLEQVRFALREKSSELEDMLGDGLADEKSGVRPEDIKLGRTVYVTALGQKGEVLTLPDKNGNLQIQVGILKVTANISSLRLADDESEKTYKKHIRTGSGIDKTMSVHTEIDVRGRTVDEATVAVEKFLDDASLASLEWVRIIHGKGTGALRSALHSALKRNPQVKSFRLGRYGEGEDGVTIVELK